MCIRDRFPRDGKLKRNTNFNSKKGNELKENQKASMCFHWKSLRRQVRVIGKVEEVSAKEADDYYNSRPYKNRIGAWASSQSEILDKRETFTEKIKEFEKKFPDQKKVPRPPHWSGWRLLPKEIEFWFCLLYTSPSPRDNRTSRMPSSA